MQRLSGRSIRIILILLFIVLPVFVIAAQSMEGDDTPVQLGKLKGSISKPSLASDPQTQTSQEQSSPTHNPLPASSQADQTSDLVKLRLLDENSLNKGLVLYYRFNNQSAYGENEDSVYDFSGMGNTGTPSPTTSFMPQGGIGRSGAYLFNGVGDEIAVADSDTLSPATTNEFTISMWVRFDELDFVGEGSYSSYKNFLGKGDNKEHEYLFRFYNSVNPQDRRNRISFYMFNPQGGLGTGSYVQEPIEKGEWVFVVGVFNGTHTQLWKNGVFKDADPLSGYNITTQNRNSPLRIGTYNGASYLNCSIDELRIYNRVLTKSEIYSLYKMKR